jgi:cell division protein FtsB
MFACILILTFQFIKIGNLKEKNKQLECYKSELINEIQTYNSTNDYYNNNRTEYLENYAREVLGWGLEGETWYTSKQSC